MLYCTSLVAWVGAGEQPALSPRRLTLCNTATAAVIQHISFPSSVLAALLSRQHLCAVLEKRVFVYKLESLELLATISTPPNPKGIGALSQAPAPALLALPASQTAGLIAVHDLSGAGGATLEISAHSNPLTLLTWNADASLLASASAKGTVVRVHRIPCGALAFTFRRGTTPARVTSMAFSPPDSSCAVLCVASDHSSIHIFRLSPTAGGGKRRAAAAVARTVLSAVVPRATMQTAGRPAVTVRLRCAKGTPVACAVLGRGGGLRLAVASPEGILYEYGLEGDNGATAELEGEWNLGLD
jgi:autophagy-related protein 18